MNEFTPGKRKLDNEDEDPLSRLIKFERMLTEELKEVQRILMDQILDFKELSKHPLKRR